MASDSQNEELSLESLQQRFQDLERDMKRLQDSSKIHKDVSGMLQVQPQGGYKIVKPEPYDGQEGGRLQSPNWSHLIRSDLTKAPNCPTPQNVVIPHKAPNPFEPRHFYPPNDPGNFTHSLNYVQRARQYQPFLRQATYNRYRNFQNAPRAPQAPKRQFTPIGETQTALYDRLLKAGRIQPIEGRVPDPIPPNYNMNMHCAYHSNFPGHDTEACWKLKNQIEDMIQNGEIVVGDLEAHKAVAHMPLKVVVRTKPLVSGRPPMNQNRNLRKRQRAPLHMRKQFASIEGTYASLYRKLLEAGKIQPIEGKILNPPPANYDGSVRCTYHSDFPGHDIEACWRFKKEIEALIQQGEILLEDPEAQGATTHQLPTVNMIEHTWDCNAINHEGPMEMPDLLVGYGDMVQSGEGSSSSSIKCLGSEL